MVVLYFPSSLFIANFTFKKFGVHISMAIGVGLNCLCLWARTLINLSFMVAMFGGSFYGIAQPLILNANPEIATNWFSSGEVCVTYAKDA